MRVMHWLKQTLPVSGHTGAATWRAGAPLVPIVLAFVVAACGQTTTGPAAAENTPTPAPTATSVPTATTTPSTPPTPTATSTPAARGYQVLVYFTRHPDSDGYPPKVFPVKRTSPDLSVATFAIQQFIAGPTAAEKQAGYYNELTVSGPSSCAGRDFTLALDTRGSVPEKGTATVKFCRATLLPGDMSGPRVTLAMTTTLLQFPTIQKVVILDSRGNCFADLSGRNFCLAGYQEKVFFSKHPDSDNTPRLVFPVNRLSPDLNVATFAITQLLAGPTQVEQQQGYFTPLAGAFSGPSIFGSNDFKITLNMNVTRPETGTATLQFGRTMRGLGDTGAAMATNEIVSTLTQFPSIQRVVILNKDGSRFDNLSG